MRVSVIIPVYNVAAYLPTCIDSVLSQDYSDLQVILVDDGATDASGALCDQAAMRDARVTVLHQPNGGLSAARNAGLLAADGEAVLFVDADDLLLPGGVSALAAAFGEDADLVVGRAVHLYPTGPVEETWRMDSAGLLGLAAPEQYGALMCESGVCLWNAWRALVRRSFLLDHGLLFNPLLRAAEDLEWFVRMAPCARRVSVCDSIPFYAYRHEREGSIMTSSSADTLQTTIQVILSSAGTLSPYAGGSFHACLHDQMITSLCMALVAAQRLPARERRAVLGAVNAESLSRLSATGTKQRLALRLLRHLGAPAAARIIDCSRSARGK